MRPARQPDVSPHFRINPPNEFNREVGSDTKFRRHARSMPVVSKSFVVIALQLLRNKFIFELADLLGGKNRILRAWNHAPSRRLSFFVPLLEHHWTAFFEFME